MAGAEQRQLNKNKGFSLVELLVAVTILAIIVVPLMHMFVTATRINVKSRNTLRATTVAQDIMEGLKAYNIDEIKAQFDKPTDGFYVVDSRLVKGAIREETALEVDSAGDPDDGIYCFSMGSVKMQGSVYDALIRVDARGYMDGTMTHDNPFNNDGIAKVGGVRWNKSGSSTDGLYAEKQELRQDTLKKIGEKFKTEMNAAGIDETKITYTTAGLGLNRTYILDITDSGSTDADGNVIADAVVSVRIDGCSYGGRVEPDFYMIDHVPCGSFAGGNFYFFYYPLYNTLDETIEINNPDNLPLNMSIIKQTDDPAVLTDAQLLAAETAYHVDVNFTGCSADKISLRTNLGKHLVNKNYLLGASQDIPGQAKFRVGGTVVIKELNIYDLAGVRNEELSKAGTGGDITEFIYDVEVFVYKEGAAAHGFPDDERMVSIRGSINN